MDSKIHQTMKITLLVLSFILYSIGNCGGPLLMRLYFVNGGNRVWLSTFLQSAGFPLTFIVLVISFFLRWATSTGTKTQLIYAKPHTIFAAAFIGLISGVAEYLYARGVSRLPVSTSAIVYSTHLAFTAGFAFLLVKQKFTSFSINAVVLLTVGAGVLVMHSSSDKPKGESHGQYILGFVMTLGGAALIGFLLPLLELTYIKAKQSVTFTLVMEIQLIVSFSDSIFCCVWMIVNNDFKVIPREARDFGLGEFKYYVVMVFTAVLWQCYFFGITGVIFCGSSLLSGITSAVLLPVTDILGVIIFKDKFGAEKGVALGLSLWGFVSYIYGEMQQNKVPEILELPAAPAGSNSN